MAVLIPISGESIYKMIGQFPELGKLAAISRSTFLELGKHYTDMFCVSPTMEYVSPTREVLPQLWGNTKQNRLIPPQNVKSPSELVIIEGGYGKVVGKL